MDELKDYNLYDVEFTSIRGYSGRAVAVARCEEEAKELTKKALEKAGYIITSIDVYDVVVLNVDKGPSSLLVGVMDN